FNYKYQIDKPEATILTGYIHLKNGTYKAEALPENIDQLNARLNIDTRNIIFEQFDVKFESSDISLTGTLKNAFPYFIPGYEEKSTKPFLDFKMTSNRLDVDKLFPEVAPGEGASFENVPADSIPPFILPDINGQGTGNIGTLVYSQVDFTNIKSNIKIEDRKIKVTDANASVYTGKVTGETEIDLNDFENPIYSGNFTATQIEANDFLSRFTKFGGHLYGKANLEGAFSASGLEPELIMKSLNMNGKSMFKEGKLVNFDIVNNFAQQFNFSAPTEEKIRDLVNSFAIKDGRIAFDAMKFISEVGDWAIDGSVGFDGTLDYKCKVLLTEKYANQIIKKLGSDLIGSLLKNDTNERIEVPFKLSGTYQKPTITIEQAFWDGLQKKFMNQQKDKLEGKVGDALKKLFGN
ncbi:MAG: AsmA-like C-terminal region-containing protein, partial [Candidatus Zixiibacteriota bacterium]